LAGYVERLELLHELLPSATVIAALVNPTNAVLGETYVRGLQAVARGLRLQLHIVNACTEQDLDKVSRSWSNRERAGSWSRPINSSLPGVNVSPR